MRIHRLIAVALLTLTAAVPVALQAQTWPTRPLKLIVPFPPGGTGDLLGRLAAKEMESSLGQPVVVENRAGAGGAIGSDAAAKAAPDGYTLVLAAKEMESALGQPVVVENRAGAGGAIGSDAAAKAAPDGYTLVLSNVASHAIGPAVYAKMPYDAVKDFTHIGLIAAVPSGIAVAANGPYASLAALLAKARTAPGAVRFGSNGNGTSSHVKLAILNRAAKVDITHIPYKGSAPATADLAGGQIDGLIAAVPDVGRNQLLRLLAITTDKRATRWPDVPTVRELGLAPLVASNWFGLSGPAGIPAPVADRLNAALVAGLNTPELAERLRDMGAEPNRMTRAEYSAMIAADVARWGDVVRSASIKVD